MLDTVVVPSRETRLTFGTRLKRAREAAGLTQTALAEALGWSNGKGRVSRFENGIEANPTIDTIEQFARAVKMPMAYLMGTQSPEQDARDEEARVETTLRRVPDRETAKRYLLERVRKTR